MAAGRAGCCVQLPPQPAGSLRRSGLPRHGVPLRAGCAGVRRSPPGQPPVRTGLKRASPGLTGFLASSSPFSASALAMRLSTFSFSAAASSRAACSARSASSACALSEEISSSTAVSRASEFTLVAACCDRRSTAAFCPRSAWPAIPMESVRLSAPSGPEHQGEAGRHSPALVGLAGNLPNHFLGFVQGLAVFFDLGRDLVPAFLCQGHPVRERSDLG